MRPGGIEHPAGTAQFSLNEGWQMIEGGGKASGSSGDWADAIPAVVPGSIQTALLQAGPDTRSLCRPQ